MNSSNDFSAVDAKPRGKPGCTPGEPGRGRAVSLPVVAVDPVTGMKKSRAGRWRAWSLGLVHILMVGHFVHWLWAGSTLTPIEPSESMETIREGKINMGTIFFALAIVATLILGRWVCGWGCHLVAYQDLSLWFFKKLGLRPRAFRTRFMVYIPLVIAAGWMFFWPAVVRAYHAYAGHAAPPTVWHLTRSGFWDTFPGPAFAIITVLVCGVAIIYFLGPKGFCTYACPYGAFFGAADRLAPARIRVTDACNQCGHCTATCTSNVDVAQEVKLYGMVVDPGCMKCLDCTQVCPNDALYVGFGRPAMGARPASAPRRRAYDLTLREELAALALFIVCLVSVNGLYGEFPFLLSLGIAGILTLLFMKAAKLAYDRDVLLQKVKLKSGGRVTRAGVVFAGVVLLLAAATAHSAVWRYFDLRANWAYRSIAPVEVMQWQYDKTFASSVDPDQRRRVNERLWHYEAAERWGLANSASNHFNAAWLYLFTDRPERAAAQIGRAVEIHPGNAFFRLWQAKILTSLGRMKDAETAFMQAIETDRADREWFERKGVREPRPVSSMIWTEWGLFQAARGELEKADFAMSRAIQLDSGHARAYIARADLARTNGEVDAARRILLEAVRSGVKEPEIVDRLAAVRQAEPQDFGAAEVDYAEALKGGAGLPVLHHNLGYALTMSRKFDEARQAYSEGIRQHPDALELRFDLGAVMLIAGDIPGMIREYEAVLKAAARTQAARALQVETALRLMQVYGGVGQPADAARAHQFVERHGSDAQREAARNLIRELESSGAGAGRP